MSFCGLKDPLNTGTYHVVLAAVSPRGWGLGASCDCSYGNRRKEIEKPVNINSRRGRSERQCDKRAAIQKYLPLRSM